MKALIVIILLSLGSGFAGLARADEFTEKVLALDAESYDAKRAAIDALATIEHERVLPIFQAMLDGNLYRYDEAETIAIGVPEGELIRLRDAITGADLGAVEEWDVDKIRINNSVRGRLRTALAGLQLRAADSSVRLRSARDLAKSPDPALRETVYAALRQENAGAVKEALELALAMIDIESTDIERRFRAVDTLGRSVAPESIAALSRLSLRDDNGKFVEGDTKLASAAASALEKAQSRIGFFKFLENLFFGISLGSVLLLAAIGLAITFGVMGVINMAHGEMIMLGAYTTFAIQQLMPNHIGLSILVAIPAAFVVSGLAGIAIERLVIRHLYGRPLETLLATFGISLILQQAVRTYNANNVPVVTPDWMSGFFQFNGALGFTYNRIYIVLFSLLVLGLLAMLLRKTLLGLQMRAVTQNRAMANSMGIRSARVDALTFGLGSGIAGMAGVALSQITNVGPNMGQGYIIDSFMVVVFGGVGNLLGTFFGAMSLGVINKFLEPYAGAVLGKIIVLVFIILFIQWRPRGLFALKGRFVED